MKIYIYITLIALLTASCGLDNVGPVLDDLDIIFFTEDGTEVQENDSDDILVEIGSTKGGNSALLTLGGTAVEGVDYQVSSDLNLTFNEGQFMTTITISLIDNTNPDDDHTIILSLPEGQGYSVDNRREFTIDIINDDVSSATVVSAISASTDDAEEGITGSAPGSMDIDSSDLEFGETEGSTRGVEMIGLRFNDLAIPNGVLISSASIQFGVDEDVDTPADVVMTIFAEAVDNSTTFEDVDFNISSRPLTTASVDWTIPIWTTDQIGTAGAGQVTADISSLIKEIIDRPGWVSGNSINIIIKPTTATLANSTESGRVAEAFDGDPALASVLTIDWER
ncbi:MAG: hypothetical protein ABJG78_03215 [Cyclobacteriaceae bacterium]